MDFWIALSLCKQFVAANGFSTIEKSAEKVSGFFRHLEAVKAELTIQAQTNPLLENKHGSAHGPLVYKALADLKLGFQAASFDGGKLISVTPAGTMMNDAWTGVERFIELENAGVVRLTEYDLGATKGKFFMLKDAVNTQVQGDPAISRVFVDDAGRSLEEIVWVRGKKFHMLTYSPEMVTGTQLKAASEVSAASLARALR